jgi:hypothetical protein
MAAMSAEIVRALEFAAVRALVKCISLERVMRAAIAPAMRRNFSLGDSHDGTCSLKTLISLTAALGHAAIPRKHGREVASNAVKARPI